MADEINEIDAPQPVLEAIIRGFEAIDDPEAITSD